MFNSTSKFWVVYGVDPAAWAKRYDIEPFSHPCYHCGVVRTTSIPFISGPLRGLIAPGHECQGEARNPPYCVVGDWSSMFPPPKPTHRDLDTQRSYRLKEGRQSGSRKCKYKGCANPNTHQGLSNGVCVTTGCQWHIAKWVRAGKRPPSSNPQRAG